MARTRLANPMNVIPLIACAATFAIGSRSRPGVVVLGLVTSNVVMGTNHG
jgi:hypothetical protein